MRLLVTLYYWVVFVVSISVGLVLAALLTLVTLPFDGQRRALHWLICHWGHQYLKVWPGWSTRVEHRERLPQEPCIIIANHQSMADIIAVLGLYYPFKFVSKASLFGVPGLGWLMKGAKYVSVERGRPKSTHEMMETCRRWLRAGMSVMIFPEGTYAPDGRLLPFKAGAFVLAMEEKVPIAPVVLEGTPALIWEDGPWLSPRAKIRVTVQEPLSVEALGSDPEAAAAKVRQQYAEWTAKKA
ncbi:MAG: 1-acyl-sn-glycerol-3-phosphate acyltransferase [Archangiaceae bacterium]|nr:1-acyl-sn-glycerol-3-phosphate acyltransferase [Archangiaceae bacterium]